LTDAKSDDVIELEHSDHWLTVWFNQPEIRNPLTDQMRVKLLATLTPVRDDKAVTAARFTGLEAHEYGFADFLAESGDELQRHEHDIRQSVLRCAPGAVADTKRLLHGLQSIDQQSVIDYAAVNFADRVESGEALEGISSFFEKRKPEWSV